MTLVKIRPFAVMGIILILIAYLVVFTNALTPFVIAAICSYILHPLVFYLSRSCKISRAFASFLIVIALITLTLFIAAAVVPLLYKQVALLISQIPKYKSYIQTSILPSLVDNATNISPDIAQKLRHMLDNSLSDMLDIIANAVNHIMNYIISAVGAILNILLVPVVLFYFLRDWEYTRDFLVICPVEFRDKFRDLISKVNNILASYIAGQFNICILLSIYYSIFLGIIGIDICAILGIISGFLVIIPLLGFLISLTIALVVTYFAFGSDLHIVYVLLLYIFGAIAESTMLTPRIIGDRIGMHPLWIIFCILVGSYFFGIAGILMSIPVACVCKVILPDLLRCIATSQVNDVTGK